MELKGKLLKCDRCGDTAFLKYIETNELDGGYTKYDVYEPEPPGWGTIHGLGDLCPTCREEYDRLIAEFKKVYVFEKEV